MALEKVIIPDSALTGILTKKYNFQTDAFKVALYTNAALQFVQITPFGLTYSTANEVAGAGYVAGGFALTNIGAPLVYGGVAMAGWQDLTTPALTISNCLWAVVYDTTAGNDVVYIMKSKSVINKTAQAMTIKFPQPTVNNLVAPIKLVVT